MCPPQCSTYFSNYAHIPLRAVAPRAVVPTLMSTYFSSHCFFRHCRPLRPGPLCPSNDQPTFKIIAHIVLRADPPWAGVPNLYSCLFISRGTHFSVSVATCRHRIVPVPLQPRIKRATYHYSMCLLKCRPLKSTIRFASVCVYVTFLEPCLI